MATHKRFILCVSNEGCEDLERRKLYEVIADETSSEGYVRVIDESGEDYLYPATNFASVDLPSDVVDALEAV